jgi:hypothetical protein
LTVGGIHRAEGQKKGDGESEMMSRGRQGARWRDGGYNRPSATVSSPWLTR